MTRSSTLIKFGIALLVIGLLALPGSLRPFLSSSACGTQVAVAAGLGQVCGEAVVVNVDFLEAFSYTFCEMPH